MNLPEARQMLDAARRDTTVPTADITHALSVTGDLDEVGWPVRILRPVGSWEVRIAPSLRRRPADPFDGLCAA